VPEQITQALGELARSHHTTVNTVLQGAWAQLLCWLTGQHDVAFGTTVSGLAMSALMGPTVTELFGPTLVAWTLE
jgi:non-ribosomal peptide synthetase component F